MATTEKSSAREPKLRLEFLDGLRGWGALIVVLYHVFIEIFPISVQAKKFLWSLFIFNGFLAVTIFFVVSGISLSIGFIARPNVEGLVKIGIGRYFRLTVPIVLASLFAWLVASSGLMLDQLHRENAESLVKVLRFAVFDVYFHNNVTKSPIPPLWTMPIELSGSFLIIALLSLTPRSNTRFLVYVLAVAISWYYSALLAAFPLGILLSESIAIFKKNRVNVRSLVAPALVATSFIAAAILVHVGPDLSPAAAESGYIVTAFALVLGAAHSSTLRGFLENAVSRWLGKISFPLFLTHSTIVFSFGVWTRSAAGEEVFNAVLANILIVAACVVTAYGLAFIDKAGIQASRIVVRWCFIACRKSRT